MVPVVRLCAGGDAQKGHGPREAPNWHDRRAVRDLVNSCIAERVATMVITHKTLSVFDRYHVVSPGELREAARRLPGTISGPVEVAAVDIRRVSG